MYQIFLQAQRICLIMQVNGCEKNAKFTDAHIYNYFLYRELSNLVLLTQAQVGDEQVSEPQATTLNLKLVRNPYLGRNKRYPFAVADYTFGQPEQLPIQKRR